MSILRFLYRKGSLKRKILDIQAEIKVSVKKHFIEKFSIIWYGAYYIDPKHLVFWILVQSDKDKDYLKSNELLKQDLSDAFVKHDYPIEARRFVSVDFESQETVDRESNGDWYLHFK